MDGVHVDVQPWSAIVYLSRDEDCRGHGAVGLYRHKATGALEASPEWEAETFKHLKGASEDAYWNEYWAYMRNKDNWEEVQRVEMVFNRRCCSTRTSSTRPSASSGALRRTAGSPSTSSTTTTRASSRG